MKDFSLCIGTPFYEIKAYSPYIMSLMNSIRLLREAGIRFEFLEVSGDSYVDRAKNTLVHQFLNGDCSHLMMIDSDLGWNADGFAKLLKIAIEGAEVVGGTFRNKGDWESYGVTPVIEDNCYVGQEVKGVQVLSALSLPGGFIIYSRKAFERTRPVLNTYEGCETILEAFRCDISAGERLGEDIYFQRKYLGQGGQLYVVPDITLTHYGTKGFEGNFDTFLKTKPGGLNHNQLIKHLANIHKGQTAWIVGKGPSLVNLKKEHFGDGPIITINEAIIPVEMLGLDNPTYSMQKDADPQEEEPIAPPKKASLLIHEMETPGRHKDYRPRYIFNNMNDFHSPWNMFSALTATYIALLMGCTEIAYVCFDYHTHGDTDCCHYNSDGTYKIVINPFKEKYGQQYHHQSYGLDNLIKRMQLPTKWVTPGKEENETSQ